MSCARAFVSQLRAVQVLSHTRSHYSGAGHVSEALCHLYSACRAAISCDQVDKTPFLTYLSAINRLPGLHCQRFNIEELSLVIQFLWTFQERQSTSVDVRSLIIVGALVLRAIRLFPRIKQSMAFVASFCRWEEISQTTKNLILQLHVTAIKRSSILSASCSQ